MKHMVPAILLLLASAAFAQPVEYRIAPGGDNLIKLEVEKTGLFKGKKHVFEFTKLSGKLSYDAQTPANSKVDLTVDAATFIVKDDWVNDKDKKKVLDEARNNMLKVGQYPEMRFTSSKVTPQGGNKFQVDGTLTIRGIAKPITIDAMLDPEKIVISGKSVFKMTGYGMKPPSAGLGTIGTKDDMTATFKVAAAK